MTRSLRAAACAASLFLIATGAANAQTAPTSSTSAATAPSASPIATTSAADFTLPAACQPSDETTSRDETHGEQLRACIRALQVEIAQTDAHQGLGQWVSALARDNADRRANGGSDDDASATSAGSTASGSTAANTGASTASTPDQPLATDAHHGHARGHQQADD